ncbi:MAG TPA: 23S rRNA (pseudouridine(1915)-N(3))-methyltransferase RlmH [Thermotogota bacterium]|mgnify:CR=1 FL=1|jgi:23S rRNA (pseudouridine1915-N3)-methyltransferase|nr:23S rRNA (pseudouridine(1915)-N(3))-methyltransferase RlmH [Thermotogota bacterium]HNR62596.1 23S rRNA (pseudouridine(1915)-N(3))-methyltransferase RlmH [Thermotogota bacterium]HNT94602.1 23S rRNA (pseudouridine(1915)-N(3))-methyltransferase RlmH [Thermotogota bacterium]HPB85996.1 23S rRNA (pseudouridine(1915)-N(3))-methyltransferase RlmH [Thermotogota bacterium]HPX97276.1 23S rRNA (pseudouridine(1915)-N(3))-methyltransferase RlmH [Thermotogota bacterium]
MRIGYIGSLKTKFVKEGIEQYRKWLTPYGKYELIGLPSGGDRNRLPKKTILENEARSVSRFVRDEETLILLRPDGLQMNTEQFADFVDRRIHEPKPIVFLVGGYMGFGEAVLGREDFSVSFSLLTFTHEIALLLLFEQLYRIARILRGEKYHY